MLRQGDAFAAWPRYGAVAGDACRGAWLLAASWANDGVVGVGRCRLAAPAPAQRATPDELAGAVAVVGEVRVALNPGSLGCSVVGASPGATKKCEKPRSASGVGPCPSHAPGCSIL
jgi:hypothetical protein